MHKIAALLIAAVSVLVLGGGGVPALAAGAFHNDSFNCQMLDGGGTFVDSSTATVVFISTSFVSNNGTCKVTCHASLLNSSGKAKKYNSGNTGLSCGMPLSGNGGLSLGSNSTTIWQETITGLGDATLQCMFKDVSCP